MTTESENPLRTTTLIHQGGMSSVGLVGEIVLHSQPVIPSPDLTPGDSPACQPNTPAWVSNPLDAWYVPEELRYRYAETPGLPDTMRREVETRVWSVTVLVPPSESEEPAPQIARMPGLVRSTWAAEREGYTYVTLSVGKDEGLALRAVDHVYRLTYAAEVVYGRAPANLDPRRCPVCGEPYADGALVSLQLHNYGGLSHDERVCASCHGYLVAAVVDELRAQDPTRAALASTYARYLLASRDLHRG